MKLGINNVYSVLNNQFTMTMPFNDIESRIIEQKIIHDGNPLLAWNVENVHGDRKANGLILPRKEKEHSPRKIDGFVALCMANGQRINEKLGEAESNKKNVESPYATRGLIGFENSQ